jgi:hypothetical protein
MSSQATGNLEPHSNFYIAGRPVGVRTTAWTILPVNQIAYAFLGSVAHDNLIEPSLAPTVIFDAEIVYVRTTKGVFQTRLRGLEGLLGLLPPALLLHVHRSIVVNASYLAGFEDGDRLRIRVGNAEEHLHASRRKFETLLKLYGLGRRDFC